jgi:hypothetical protein
MLVPTTVTVTGRLAKVVAASDDDKVESAMLLTVPVMTAPVDETLRPSAADGDVGEIDPA